MKKAPKQSENSARLLELDLAHVKERLAAKEREVEGLYRQILNQDKAFAEAYREQEASFREREEKLIVKLFDEVQKFISKSNFNHLKGKIANRSANRAAAQDRRARRANPQFAESTWFFSKKRGAIQFRKWNYFERLELRKRRFARIKLLVSQVNTVPVGVTVAKWQKTVRGWIFLPLFRCTISA